MSTIDPSFLVPKFYIVAEREVCSTALEIINLMSDVVSSNWTDETQIELQYLTGHTFQDAATIGVAAIFLAQGADLVFLWQQSFDYPFTQATMLANRMGVYINAQQFEEVRRRFIKNKSRVEVNLAFDSLPANYSISSAYNALQKATAANGRLLAVTPGSTFMTNEQWETRLAKVSVNLSKIEEQYRSLVEFNNKRDALRQQAKLYVDGLFYSLGLAKYESQLADLLSTHISTIQMIQNLKPLMVEIGKGYITSYNQLLRKIEQLCPAE